MLLLAFVLIRGEESIPLSDCLQVTFSRSCRHHLFVVYAREIVIMDIGTKQEVGSIVLERNSSPFLQVMPCKQRSMLYCLHENGSVSIRTPPTRGNRRAYRAKDQQQRSIPAHAGEPTTAARRGCPNGVYPRPRGGTALSSNVVLRLRRSIPAHAGEPGTSGGISQTRWVYPRPRGGTSLLAAWTKRLRGLSPPTRGNPIASAIRDFGHGSIPTHAGEPRCSTHCARS